MSSSHHSTRSNGLRAPASTADLPDGREVHKVDPAASPVAAKEPVPSWLQPFAAGINTRFTRTPNYISPPRIGSGERIGGEPRFDDEARYADEARSELAPPARMSSPAPGRDPIIVARQTREPIDAPPSPERTARPVAPMSPPPRDRSRMAPPPMKVTRIERRQAEAAEAPVQPPVGRKRAAPMTSMTPVTVNVSFSWPLDILAVPVSGRHAIRTPEQAPEPAPRAEAAPDPRRKRPVAVAAPAPVVPVYDDADEDAFEAFDDGHDGYQLPSLDLLSEPLASEPSYELSAEFLDQTSLFLQQTLRDFGVRGEIIDANPGPVVTLYELEPAPGTKSSRVIGLSADIARSMSAVSARVAVVEGRNVIGIELPNRERETVWLRELLASQDFSEAKAKLGLCLGKTIGGEPVIADLARMPHLLVAGTTGSGKSVAINTMILSLLYRHRPDQCRLIMIDPKMLELSVYDGIPHLLTPVVTDPKKAVTALKWAVREMEERYKKMSRLGVRNIDGFNERVTEARARGETITRTIDTGFDRETGEATQEEQVMDLANLPFIVIIVDEMADLMMVAGKDIETAIQRLAQMARAAGIHIVMATQRPSVDVITGTIKANFPTRISFQVTSKIDSRTILGEMGAETLLGQGDMLYMAGGGRITRVHGPFVSDLEVEHVVAHLKRQGRPEYLDEVTSGDDDEVAAPGDDGAVFDRSAMAEDGADPYEQAIAVVLRDRKASTSYIQRRLGIGYNRAASIMERMENEGIVGAANHAGKREILRDVGR